MAVNTVLPAVFIWATAQGSPERKAWLMQNYNQPVTEDEYIQHVKELPHDHRRAARCRAPGGNRRDYKHLKARFGFFTPAARAE